ncbi:kinase-like protein [Ceratobasidium sp. AG-I]|nr:kinase-like protein [Ceratobasidium sp. AG-I]
MFDLKHKNLVDIYGVSAEPSANGFLIMESYSTNLLSYRESLDYQNQLRVFCEVLEGLQALHTSVPPIAHQCLKASNIMVDEHGSVKLSLMNSEPYLAFAVEPSPTRSYSPNWPIVSRWWSPEVFKDKTKLLTVENDIWAFGCVVLEVLTGSAPYPKFEEDASLVNHIRADHSPDSGLRRAPKLRMWQDVRRCWSTPRPTTGYMLNVFCDYLAREVMRGVPDLTAQIAKAANPFVRGRTADIYSGIYTNRRERSEQISVGNV